jgi:predicted transcriptional regulator
MKANKRAEKYSSSIIAELLSEISSTEKMQLRIKMQLAARLDDLIVESGLNKSEFASKMDKNPSEISKWLSGTHNFTIDTLVEISEALNIHVQELFAPKSDLQVNSIQIGSILSSS